jgi:hypothetical protein
LHKSVSWRIQTVYSLLKAINITMKKRRLKIHAGLMWM